MPSSFDAFSVGLTIFPTGHETSSSALTWTFYALACAPHVQTKLRTSLRELNIPPSSSTPTTAQFHQILTHPYLDACVRESLRLHSPVTSTMRVAAHGDAVPVATPFRDRHGTLCDYIKLNKGDIITIPIQAIHKAQACWGSDAEIFRPERWLEDAGTRLPSADTAAAKNIQGLWGGILTFGSGNVVNGNRSCIGYRFALNE